MDNLLYFLDIFLHLDKHLADIIATYGNQTYLILFLIVFLETGLVVTPFLPGDSLLFAAGALTPSSSMNINLLLLGLTISAILGDALNYQIGRFIGKKALAMEDKWYFKKSYIEKTEKFYQKYGTKTIIIARFVPIVRTFAPFLAGIGEMKYSVFARYNIIGAILWVNSLTLAGYFFGGMEIVKKNFGLVVVAIIVISILPAVFEVISHKLQSREEANKSA